MDFVGAESGRALFHDKTCNSLVHLCSHNCEVSDRAVRDPALGAVEHPSAAVFASPCYHTSWIRTVVGFREAETAKQFALGHLRQVSISLLFGTGRIDCIHR